MISVTTKSKKYLEQPLNIIRVFLALVFLSAGFFRIFNSGAAALELANLQLPAYLSGLIIIFEIMAGFALLINKYVRYIYWLLIFFLTFILVWSLIINGQTIIRNVGELFVFNFTPTDLFLHFVFLLLVIVLLIKKK